MVVPVVLCLTVTSHTKLAIVFTLDLQSFDMFECPFQMHFKYHVKTLKESEVVEITIHNYVFLY